MSENGDGGWPELPEGWEWKRLGELVGTSSGGTPSRKRPDFYSGGTVPWLKIGDLNDGVVDSTNEKITEAALQDSSAKKLPVRTLLVAMYGSIGKLGFLGMEAATNQAICALHTDDDALRNYLYWYLRYQRQTLLVAGFGGTQANISQTFLRKLPIPLPPRNEQRRIVSQVEGLVAGLAAARRSLEAADRNLVFLRRAVVDRAADPDQWELRDLGDLLAVSLTNGRSVPTADDGFPVLRLTALRKGVVDLEQSKTGAWTASEAFPYLVRGGDFLVARGNGSLSLVGRGGLVEHQSPPPVAFPDTMIRIRVEDDAIRREYLRLIWDSRLIREQIEQQAHTTAGIYKINQTMLRALQLRVPPIAAQDRLVREADESLSGLDKLQTIVHRQSVAGEQLQRSVLRAAFMGKLVTHTSGTSAMRRVGAVPGQGASECLGP